MCLTTKQRFPRISFKDIHVKKVLWKNPKDQTKLYTPIALHPINWKQEYLIPKEKQNIFNLFFGKFRERFCYGIDFGTLFGDKGKYKYRYSIGFIHSHETYFPINSESEYVVLDAIIPAGTPYYYDPDNNEYCSTKLKLIWP